MARKKKSPKEIIESIKDPHLESIYIKFPGEEMKLISAHQRLVGLAVKDEEKEKKIINDYLERHPEYKFPWVDDGRIELHTHPTEKNHGMVALPSGPDIQNFLARPKLITMVIAQTDSVTGGVQGYTILRKKKDNYKGPLPVQVGPTWQERYKDAEDYQDFAWSDDASSPSKILKSLAKKYNFQYKWVPAKGYKISDENWGGYWRFMEKGLEKSVVGTILIFLMGGIVLLFPTITGNVVSNSTVNSNNIIGTIFLLTGLIGGFIFLRKRK